MNRGGFSWKRFVGISAAKSRISRSIGIPLTKSGRQRKIGRMGVPGVDYDRRLHSCRSRSVPGP